MSAGVEAEVSTRDGPAGMLPWHFPSPFTPTDTPSKKSHRLDAVRGWVLASRLS